MTRQDLNIIALTDDELEVVVGGAGQWVPPASGGKWWTWEETTTSPTGSSISRSPIRVELIDGKRHGFKYDGTAEVLHRVL